MSSSQRGYSGAESSRVRRDHSLERDRERRERERMVVYWVGEAKDKKNGKNPRRVRGERAEHSGRRGRDVMGNK
jgi:hypothetical protein